MVDRAVAVSPRHSVTLDDDYLAMIDRAPREDFVVRTLAKRMAGEMPLMTGELVIAGAATREKWPLAAIYPLHFRKTYYPGKMHGDPRVEAERQNLASTLVPVPPAIGATHNSFRSCMLPGTPLNRLTDLGAEPEDANIAIARALPTAAAIGMWKLAEDGYRLLTTMQAGGITHGDAHWHNFIVCTSPAELLPIDFERAVLKASVDEETWRRRCNEDLRHFMRLALYLQCALGRQAGPLAELTAESMEELVNSAAAFKRAIAEHTHTWS